MRDFVLGRKFRVVSYLIATGLLIFFLTLPANEVIRKAVTYGWYVFTVDAAIIGIAFIVAIIGRLFGDTGVRLGFLALFLGLGSACLLFLVAVGQLPSDRVGITIAAGTGLIVG